MSQRQVKFGIIGAGEIARACLPAFKDNPRLAAVAVADVNREAAARLAHDVGASKSCADYHELLRDDKIEAVYIATPPFLHRQMILDALAARKHIICEKPLAMNADEAREICAASDAAGGLKIGSCSSRFLQKAAVATRQLIQDGSLGKLERIGFFMSRPGNPSPADWSNWRIDKSKSGGGLLMDWGVYDLDWLSYVLGERFQPTSILATLGRARGNVESIYSAQVFCADGLRIDLQRRGAEHGPTRDLIELRGSAGGLDVPMIPSENPPTLYRFDESLQSTRPQTPWIRDWNEVTAFPVQDLADAILEDRTPLTTPARSLLIHQIIDAAYRSAARGQVERI
jgi:predicted dehydrogenase